MDIITSEKLAKDFTMLLATIDPIGTLTLFVALTAKMDAKARRAVAIKATLYAAVILVASVVLGQIILQHMQISMTAFQIAGGIILFLFGLQMVFGVGEVSGRCHSESGHDIAVFPLAIPSIASPGAIMAAVMLTDNDKFNVATQAATSSILLFILLLTLLGMLCAGRIHKLIGDNGAAVLIKVMGLLLASVAVECVIHAFVELTAHP